MKFKNLKILKCLWELWLCIFVAYRDIRLWMLSRAMSEKWEEQVPRTLGSPLCFGWWLSIKIVLGCWAEHRPDRSPFSSGMYLRRLTCPGVTLTRSCPPVALARATTGRWADWGEQDWSLYPHSSLSALFLWVGCFIFQRRSQFLSSVLSLSPLPIPPSP
jgi:hypothetical protein